MITCVVDGYISSKEGLWHIISVSQHSKSYVPNFQQWSHKSGIAQKVEVETFIFYLYAYVFKSVQ
jgi:hypothetical protein